MTIDDLHNLGADELQKKLPVVTSHEMWKKAFRRGPRFFIQCVLARMNYVLWRYVLREVAIIESLTVNYDRVPKGTPSRLIVGVFAKSSLARMMLVRTRNRLQRKLISQV